ncbi:hypothetical protein DY000_02011178 [Brassica cretica]|uniref:Uncharacterized protein n=1 Tax=Brassica cretica TaxID=69181 RepID=A0ABQ7CXB6_BRACR|nr:hypothetical protein DY000_02011178 [Brassica cretica]
MIMQDGSMNLLVTTGVKNHRPGEGNPLPSELAYGANRVELYRCNFCPAITRFPWHNDPLKVPVLVT